MQKIFSFKGITRNTGLLYSKEGECNELVNMRQYNGALVPMHKPLKLASFPYNYKAIYRHELVSTYFCVTEEEGIVHLYNDKFEPLSAASNDVSVLSDDCKNVERVEFMGNIACLFTSTSTCYAIFDTDSYKWLGEHPVLPSLLFKTNSQVHEITTDSAYYYGTATDTGNEGNYWINAATGYYDECVAKLNERGYYIDRALFRYAFRLFDGSYAYLSPIYYVHDCDSVGGLSRDSQNFFSYPITSNTQPSTYKVKVQGFKPTFVFESFDLSQWENIIVSIDVFSSGSVLGHKIVSDGSRILSRREMTYTSVNSSYERYEEKTSTEIYTDVTSQQLFYKVAEFNLKGELIDELKDVSLSSLSLSEALSDDSMSHIGRTASFTYVFNGRLHLAGLREYLFKGYDSHCFAPATMERISVPCVVYTELNTNKGVSVLKKDYGESFRLGVADGKYYMTPFIMYPDERAAKMTFYITIAGVIYTHAYTLVRHKTLNVAFYLHETGDGITITLSGEFANSARVIMLSSITFKRFFAYKKGVYEIVLNENGEWYYGDILFAAAVESTTNPNYGAFSIRGTVNTGDKIIVSLIDSSESGRVEDIDNIEINELWEQIDSIPCVNEVNTMEYRGNILKVSGVDNPFYFPAKQTYTPSKSDIVALCSNTVALSQGQFGQHPLYVFCADGIWAMATDTSGTIAYSASYPLSREVCINATSVKGIDSGVVFITRKGVMLLNGGNVTQLSAVIDEIVEKEYNINDNDIISRIASLVSLQNVLSVDDFFNYSEKASVGFFYDKRELIISNPAYTYSYVFSLDSGQWSKYTAVFGFVSNSYPNFMGIYSDGDRTNVYTMDCNRVDDNDVMIITRPLLYGTKLHKRVMQLVLHASVRIPDSSSEFKGLACYMLCSNDAENFKLISGSERRKDFKDMVFPYIPTQSYRYFAIAIVGRITTDSTIVAVEMAVDAAWNNRLN